MLSRRIVTALLVGIGLLVACGGQTDRDFTGSGRGEPTERGGSAGSMGDASASGGPNTGGGQALASAGQPGTGGAVGSGPCLSYEISEPVLFDEPMTNAVVAWIGDAYAIVWTENNETSFAREWFSVQYLSVDRAGQTLHRETAYSFNELDEYGLIRDVGPATVVAAAAAGDGLGVIFYHDVNEGENELPFARLTASGTAATAPSVIATGNAPGLTRVIWNGSGFGASWVCGNGLCFAELDESGRLVGEILAIPANSPVVALYLFWNGQSYALAWEESLPVLMATRFLTVSPGPSAAVESILLSDPDMYAGGLFVNQVGEHYCAVWSEMTKRDPVQTRLLMVELDRTGNVVGEPVQLEEAPMVALRFNGHEYGALLGNYTTIDSRGTHSYGFSAMSPDGNRRMDEVEVIPAEMFAQIVSFDWHETGFGLFWTQPEDDERRMGYLQIRCQR
jgi:hypothetical protein